MSLWYNGSISSIRDRDMHEPRGNVMDSRKHILIVDDDVELASLLAQAVNDVSEAYEVKVAKDVDGAMVLVNKAQLAQHPFDLVITDIKMIGLSGLELLEALATIAPDTKTITMTAYNSPELAERAQELNVYAFLTKPFVLSQFRQIVRSALYPDKLAEDTGSDKSVPQLSSAQRVAVGRHLATMRAMTGTSVALLMHRSGAVLQMDSSEADSDLRELCAALASAQQAISDHTNRTFETDSPIKQCYFGTDTYSICTYSLEPEYLIAVIFGPAVKEGQVWYYMRETAKKVETALSANQALPVESSTPIKEDLFDILDQYFPNRNEGQPSRGRSRSARANVPPPTVTEEIPAPPVVEPQQDSVELSAPAGLPSLEDIDWNVSTDLEWEDIATTAAQGFEGISLQEAQGQGLFPATPSPAPAPEVARSTESSSSQPAVDEIDWDIDTDAEWDDIVTTTDQGFGGISFEQARQDGIIDDLPAE
jgi:CheY-like chemotaxis protein/predicted regulator of Ras-like GTPase activity (Roadblock/LC7/MglB family)